MLREGKDGRCKGMKFSDYGGSNGAMRAAKAWLASEIRGSK